MVNLRADAVDQQRREPQPCRPRNLKGWAPQGPDAGQSYRRLVCAEVFQQSIDGTSIYNYKPTTTIATLGKAITGIAEDVRHDTSFSKTKAADIVPQDVRSLEAEWPQLQGRARIKVRQRARGARKRWHEARASARRRQGSSRTAVPARSMACSQGESTSRPEWKKEAQGLAEA